VPLLSRKAKEQLSKSSKQSGNNSSLPALSEDGRDVVWQIPSTYTHGKYWTVHLAL
jgi:hypothetical protein